MTAIFAVVGALALSALPVILLGARRRSRLGRGARRGPGLRERLEGWAWRTGTGLSARQLLLGYAFWVGAAGAAGFLIGGAAGTVGSLVLALLVYQGWLSARRQDYSLELTRDMLRGLRQFASAAGTIPTPDALRSAAAFCSRTGREVYLELARSLQAAPPGSWDEVVERWAARYPGPVQEALRHVLAGESRGIRVRETTGAVREALSGVARVLGSARAEARGVEFQAIFLALWPLGVAAFMRVLGLAVSDNPLFLLPAALGGAVSYTLTFRTLERYLSIDVILGRDRRIPTIPDERITSPLGGIPAAGRRG